MDRREFLMGTAATAVLATMGGAMFGSAKAAPEGEKFEITKSADEWKRILSPAAYDVLREHGTERAGTSPLNAEKREGLFHCAGCDLPVYSSETKFESGTGWPSFWAPIPHAVTSSTDRKFFMTRTEIHCRRCGGHLGHVFDDGPAPTGKRYCMNGVAMTFKPATT
jgi:peptide-methionine (R)-S-oxide reductase